MKRNPLLLLVFMFLFTRLSAQENLYPYLQAVEPNSIYINWLSRLKDPTSEVYYGLSADNLSESAKAELTKIKIDGHNYHQVKLENLTPNAKYYYKVVSKVGSVESFSEVRSFKTLPEPGRMATADGHIRFLVLGDNQLQGNDRYNRFVQAAYDMILQKWGPTPDDHVAMTVMVGDQVDIGMGSHYANVHFAKNRVLSGYLPIQTLVGNHETYGIPGLQLYRDLFVLDEFSYKGIQSGTEDFFARQAGNVLFIGFCSEKTSEADDEKQEAWLKKIIAEVEHDETVDWIVSLSHRPYQTEQYIGDIYPWVRETAVPMLSKLEKYVLHIGAHHHNYARGQLKDAPVYHMISGGTAWDQYWGYGKEENYDDVQKTISQWCYQIIDVDLEKKSFSVEVYSIGSVDEWLLNANVDGFHRVKGQAAPEKPSLELSLDPSVAASLKDLKLRGSVYASPVNEECNSTQFQVSKFDDFSVVQFESYRHFEDLFGMGDRKDHTVDQMEGVDMFEVQIPERGVEKGVNYARVRYRDKNLNWSEWSDPVQFVVGEGGKEPEPKLTVQGNIFPLEGPIRVSYQGAKKDKKPWIGLYKHDAWLGTTPSRGWYYAAQDSTKASDFREVGNLTFDKLTEITGSGRNPGMVTAPEPGRYKCVLFHYEGLGAYNVDAETPVFYIGPTPELSMLTALPEKGFYASGSEIKIGVANAPAINRDIIHVFRVGDSVHLPDATHNRPAGSVEVKDLTKSGDASYLPFTPTSPGYYYAAYYVEGTPMMIGNVVAFQVGEKVGEIKTDKASYQLNEPITVTWKNTPGIPKDWIGIYKKDDDPQVNSSDESGYSYTYFDGVPYGTAVIGENERPKVGGEYFAAVFTNDSYTEVTNRAFFKIEDPREVPTFKVEKKAAVYGDEAFVLATVSNGKPLTLRSKNEQVVTVDGDNPAKLKIKGAGAAVVRCSVEGDAQYQPAAAEVDISVGPAQLTVAAKDFEKVYDGKPYVGEGGLRYEGFVYGENESVVFGDIRYLGTGYGAIDAGSYAIEPSGLQAFNYTIQFEPGMLRIQQAPLTGIELHDKTFAYDGQPHSLEVVGDLPKDATVLYENNGKIEPGEYTVKAKIIGGRNYQNLELTAKLTITGTSKPADPNQTTAVESALAFSVAPNPASGSLTVTSTQAGRYALYDNLGRSVRAFSVAVGETVVDLRGIQPGLYILRGETGQGLRLVVQ